jgi:hypothetical protein
VAFALPLGQPLDRHRAGRHVDAERQRLGGEHRLDQALGEQFLDRLLEQRQHAGVVAGHAPSERLGQGVVAERVQVGGVDRRDLEVEELQDLGPLCLAGEADVGRPALLERLVAAGTGEDEVDGGQQPFGLQQVDDLHPGRHPAPPDRPWPAAAAALAVAAGAPLPLAPPGQRRVGDHAVAAGDEHRVQLAADQVVVVEGDRPALLDHDIGGASGRLQPLAELLGVGDRRRQARHPHLDRQVDQHLLPDGAADAVLQVVDLVHDHVAQPGEGGAALVEHVAQHLGGHHHHRRLAVDGVVAGQQADLRRTVAGHEVAELLVGERLQRGGVERLAAGPQRQPHGELPHHRLAGAGRGRHQRAAAAGERQAASALEVVELEGVAAGELLHQRPQVAGLARPPGGKLFHGAHAARK